VQRMSALDAQFLHLEDGVNHMHIGACNIFEGPCPTEAEARDLFTAALPLIPRYRQHLRTVPLELGRPVWEDDPTFDLDNHLFATTVAAPGGEAELQALTAGVMSTELDRRRPLWEAWVVDGLADDRWALLCKVHHCMVDGVAGVDLMAVLLSDSPDVAEVDAAADDWSAEPGASETHLLVDALGDMAQPLLGATKAVVDAVTHPAETVRQVASIASGTRTWAEDAKPTPTSEVTGTIGPDRSWVWARASLDEAKAIKDERGGTVNDVVLAAVTQGFREVLAARGEDPGCHEIRTLVPVSVRVEHGVLDNQVSALVAELPVRFATPELRYEAVCTESRKLKASDEAEAGEAMTRLADLVPAPMMAFGTRAIGAVLRHLPQRNITTVTTNIPGPQFPLYAAGRRMVAYYPFVPIAFGIRYAVAVLSYDGVLYFGLTGDQEASPDLDVLAKGIEAGFAELVA
jgi:diacylglycerol O-acyltransferase / wax synthase